MILERRSMKNDANSIISKCFSTNLISTSKSSTEEKTNFQNVDSKSASLGIDTIDYLHSISLQRFSSRSHRKNPNSLPNRQDKIQDAK